MIRENPKITEEVFQEISQKILGSQQKLQEKLIDDLFGNFNTKPQIHNIKIIQENEEQEEEFNSRKQQKKDTQNMVNNQSLPQTELNSNVTALLKNKINSLSLRFIVHSSIQTQSLQILQEEKNYSHKDIQIKAKNLLLKYFCHYCKIFEEIQLQPEARRLERDVNKLFTSNSIEVCSSLFRKGFRKMVSLFKCLVKIMVVGNFISKITLFKIEKQINILIGVRVEEILIEHEKLAYEFAFKLKGMLIPADFDIEKIKKNEKREKLAKRKQRLKIYKLVKNELRKPQTNRNPQSNSIKNCKIEEQTLQKSYKNIFTERPHQQTPTFQSHMKLEKQSFNHVTTTVSENLPNYLRQMRPTKLETHSKSEANFSVKSQPMNHANMKAEHFLQHDFLKSKQIQQKPQKPAYKVVETILLDESSDDEKQKAKIRMKSSELQKFNKSQISQSTDAQGSVEEYQKSRITNLSKKLSSDFITQIKKKLNEQKLKKQ